LNAARSAVAVGRSVPRVSNVLGALRLADVVRYDSTKILGLTKSYLRFTLKKTGPLIARKFSQIQLRTISACFIDSRRFLTIPFPGFDVRQRYLYSYQDRIRLQFFPNSQRNHVFC
jgi:hypothetical protein